MTGVQTCALPISGDMVPGRGIVEQLGESGGVGGVQSDDAEAEVRGLGEGGDGGEKRGKEEWFHRM